MCELRGDSDLKLTCPHCGASFEVPPNVTVATCSYCGTTFRVDNKELQFSHQFYPVTYDSNAAYEQLKALLSRQFGVPSNFSDQVVLVGRRLHYIPLYVFYVEGSSGSGDSAVLESDYVVLPSMRILPVPIPAEYKFPVRGKIYFKPQMLKDGQFYSPQLSVEYLEEFAKSKIYNRLAGEVQLASPGAEISLNSRCESLVHYPIWELKYSYLKFNFVGYVDGVCGEVFSAEYPISTIHRTLSLSLASGLMISSLAVGAFVGSFFASPIVGLIGGVIPAVLGAVPIFRRSAFKVQRYVPQIYGEISEKSDFESLIKKGLTLSSIFSNITFKVD